MLVQVPALASQMTSTSSRAGKQEAMVIIELLAMRATGPEECQACQKYPKERSAKAKELTYGRNYQ